MPAEAAVSIAVQTLGQLLVEKVVFLKDVKKDVEWLRKELKSMQCFLKDAAKKQSDSEGIRNWMSDIREAAHDAEDAIEIFVLSRGWLEKFTRFPSHMHHLNKVGKEIDSIKTRLKDIEDRRVRLGLQDLGGHERATYTTRAPLEIEKRRRLAYRQNDKHVVGMEKDVKILLREAVLKESEGVSVAAILGMGGMGKSTLAGKVYNHPEVSRRFDFRSWLVVSSEFTAEDIMKQILLQLGVSDEELKRSGSIEDKLRRQEELKRMVHERLAGKRYFIVLDDVWEVSHWESLSSAFPHGDKGSRLLLTSRNPIITMSTGYVHNMKPLDADESWDLFMRKAFGVNNGIDGCPEELKKVAEEILKKCGGLPLAISVVGGLLANKTRSKREWEKVFKEMKSHFNTSYGDINVISAILELSYHNLPLQLKGCFLCLGFFKEDAIIKVKELVHIWVAQGLVAHEFVGEEERKEDVARDYFNDLISRNMIQGKEMDRCGDIKLCQMHDLLRDLSIRKAEEEIDFEVLREEMDSNRYSLAKPRNRAIYCSETRFVFSTNRNQHLRSMFIHQEQEPFFNGSGQSSYWKSFELLRVLHLGNARLKALPKAIGELTGLRYLKMKLFSSPEDPRLPHSWTKLKNLEVLDLRGSHYTGLKIDKVILKMESLCHIYAYVDASKVALQNMRNLRTLHMFRVRSCSNVWKIQGMKGVSKLGLDVFRMKETSSLFRCLSLLENLSHLTLLVGTPETDMEGLTSLHRVTRLKLHSPHLYLDAPASYFPPNLLHLTLTKMRLEGGSMPVLEKLPDLLSLKLDNVYIPNGMVITSGGFPTLKLLRLEGNRRRLKMTIEESAMPKLNQLIIHNCEGLDVVNLPERIKSAIIQPH